MKKYEGKRVGSNIAVTVNDKPLNPRFDLIDYHVNELSWGRQRTMGEAQLALALLADYLNDDREALLLHQKFKTVVVENLPSKDWTLTNPQIDLAVRYIRASSLETNIIGFKFRFWVVH